MPLEELSFLVNKQDWKRSIHFDCFQQSNRGIRLSGETVGKLGKADRVLICQERAGRPLKIRGSGGVLCLNE